MEPNKQESQYARSLIEASLDPMITISSKGKIMDMNQATMDITGVTRENLIGSDFFEYFTEPQNARMVYQDVFEKGFVSNYPLTIRDHKLTDVLFNGSVYKDEQGNVLGAVVVARDITEHKRIEKELTEARVFPEFATGIAEQAKSRAESATRIAEDAVKFTNTGRITVSIRLLEEDDEKAIIEFADTGIGIPENKIGKIFENFQQASSGTSRMYGGTGLGLAIVKQLVEPQCGTISVKSNVGKGSTFSFILSFQKTEAAAEPEMQIAELDTEPTNIRILVVEDIALNQLLMKTILEDSGFECDIPANGRIAIERLETQTYDLILMDLQMPEMTGFEATGHIRNKMNSKIPIIALTADVTTVDLAKCKAVGMNDYIAKPVDERLLYRKIIGLVISPPVSFINKEDENSPDKKRRCVDLDYLVRRTKSNPALMLEMISLYLEQTPHLISAMKRSLYDKDWGSLYSAIHKMIPSFSIMGISIDFENMAKKVQEFARTQQQTDSMPDLVLQLETVCTQACEELKEEFNRIKSTTREQRK